MTWNIYYVHIYIQYIHLDILFGPCSFRPSSGKVSFRDEPLFVIAFVKQTRVDVATKVMITKI